MEATARSPTPTIAPGNDSDGNTEASATADYTLGIYQSIGRVPSHVRTTTCTESCNVRRVNQDTRSSHPFLLAIAVYLLPNVRKPFRLRSSG